MVVAVGWVGVVLTGPHRVCAGEPSKGTSAMSYGEALQELKKYTEVIELVGEGGARVAVCPQFQGRVMTSTCAGPEGLSFGFINWDFLRAGKSDKHFNNYGGEDRFWLSPEGGPYSLWFAPGVPQTLEHWFTPPAFNEGAWPVVSKPEDPFCRMRVPMKLQNTAGTRFEVEVERTVRLLKKEDLAQLFGPEAAGQIAGQGVRWVGYETMNVLTNKGEPMTQQKGLISIWIAGMMNAGPQTVVIVPYKAGPESVLGPVVETSYFGTIPPERIKITPQAVLFLADANYRSKIGTSQRRARNVAGSIDFQNQVLTLVHFSMPDNPAEVPYMCNLWGEHKGSSYEGDVFNSYTDGPPGEGKPQMGKFYELESLSPAAELRPGESLRHAHRTVHIQADLKVLKPIARQVLGVDLDEVRQQMFGGK
jgi:hypothetical protein